MRKPVLVGVIFVLVVLAVIVYSSFHLTAYGVEVCMNFNGRTACSTAKAASKEDALQNAMSTACGQIAFGVTDSIACSRTEPAKETWLP
jgi:hypothetical protein